MLNIFLLKEDLQTKPYPSGGTYMYIDVPLEEALPPAIAMRRRPWLCYSYAQALNFVTGLIIIIIIIQLFTVGCTVATS